MYDKLQKHLQKELDEIRQAGLFKEERIIASPQGAEITLADGRKVINFCANNYLGLADSPELIAAAKAAMDARGYGMSSVRFICGTQDIHKNLEKKIAEFYGMEDAIISDALNHASIIDGVRLCKAARYRYANNDMDDLEKQLQEADRAGSRFKIVVTDGVFSMDGVVANLRGICGLAEKYDALVMVDESHAAGFIGRTGRGTIEHCGVEGRVDIVTGTLGKALGGAMGGYTTGPKEIIEILRQRSRPYLFSNSLCPSIVGAATKAFEMVMADTTLRDRTEANTRRFKEGIRRIGLDVKQGDSSIIPVMLYDAPLAQKMAQRLLEEGIYVTGFFYPVVPKGQARIRVQISAAHTPEQIDRAVAAFEKVGRELGAIR